MQNITSSTIELNQLKIVQENGHNIQYMDNPSLNVQLAAVNQSGLAIQYITDPVEEVKLAAVKNNGLAIMYIDNPSEQVQLESVNWNGKHIKFINNPSEKIMLTAVKNNGYAVEYIDQPSYQVQLATIKYDPRCINLIFDTYPEIESMVTSYKCKYRELYVLKLETGEFKFSIACQVNMSKQQFIDRIYNENGGLICNPHRQEYLDILSKY